jgi:hypothetical protein
MASTLLFATGVGLALYPNNSFVSELFNRDKFLKLAPYADDVWFWAMEVVSGLRVKAVSRTAQIWEHPRTSLLPKKPLWSINSKKNDIQLEMVIAEYNLSAKLHSERLVHSAWFSR